MSMYVYHREGGTSYLWSIKETELYLTVVRYTRNRSQRIFISVNGWSSINPLSHMWQMSRMHAFYWCGRRLSQVIRPSALVVISWVGSRCTKNSIRSSGKRFSSWTSPTHMQDIIIYPVPDYTMDEAINTPARGRGKNSAFGNNLWLQPEVMAWRWYHIQWSRENLPKTRL